MSGIEWRKQPHRFIERLAPDALKQGADIIGRMVVCVQLGNKPAGVLDFVAENLVGCLHNMVCMCIHVGLFVFVFTVQN